MASLIGNKPNQLPSVADLGNLAFQNSSHLPSLGAETTAAKIITTDNTIGDYNPTVDLDFVNSESSYAPNATVTRASIASYTGKDGVIKYASENEMRIDYDPITAECRGLLLEKSSTNLLKYSQDLTNSIWTKTNNVEIGNEHILSPDGISRADKLVASVGDGTAVTHFIRQTAIAVSAPSYYTGSFYAKAAERDIIKFIFSGYPIWEGYPDYAPEAYFDLTNELAVTFNPYSSVSIKHVGNGWYRCSMTVKTTTAANTVFNIFIADHIPETYDPLETTDTTFIGDGFSGVHIWGTQFERYSILSSYIPTEGATVTRDVDKYTIATAAQSPYNWTMFCEWSVPFIPTFYYGAYETNRQPICLNDGTTANRVVLALSRTNTWATATLRTAYAQVYNSSTISTFELHNTNKDLAEPFVIQENALYKQAITLNAEGSSYYVDQRKMLVFIPTPNTTNIQPLNTLRIGSGGIDNYTLSGHIRKVRLIRAALPKAELLEMVDE